jgi:hypothetical protein
VVAQVVGLELREEVPEVLVVRPDHVVRQLVQQGLNQSRVRHEACEVRRAQPHVDACTVVGVVPKETLALRVRLLRQAVVHWIHLAQRAHHPLALPQDVQDARVARQLEKHLARLEGVRRVRRRPGAEGLPRARIQPTAAVLALSPAGVAPLTHLIGHHLTHARRGLGVLRLEASHRRVGPWLVGHRFTSACHHHQLVAGPYSRCRHAPSGGKCLALEDELDGHVHQAESSTRSIVERREVSIVVDLDRLRLAHVDDAELHKRSQKPPRTVFDASRAALSVF